MLNIYMKNIIDIVVAHYNSVEFENLIELFNKEIDSNILIYNKSSKNYENNQYNYIKRENIGREGETYLNHIISNYDNLNDYTLFIQDDTDNHILNYNILY